jgi:hypothetical protein
MREKVFEWRSRLFKLDRRTEFDGLAGWDLHGRTRAGIAAYARGFLLHAERSETREGKTLPFAERLYGHPDNGIDGFARVDFRNVRIESDSLDQLRFVHIICV